MEILATFYADPEKSAGTWAGSEPIPTAAENKKRYRSAGFLRIGVLFWISVKKLTKKRRNAGNCIACGLREWYNKK